jgi:hypothetical protein
MFFRGDKILKFYPYIMTNNTIYRKMHNRLFNECHSCPIQIPTSSLSVAYTLLVLLVLFSVNLMPDTQRLKYYAHFYSWDHSTKFIKVQGPMLIHYAEKLTVTNSTSLITTPCQLSATPYPIYLHLSSISEILTCNMPWWKGTTFGLTTVRNCIC